MLIQEVLHIQKKRGEKKRSDEELGVSVQVKVNEEILK